MLSYALHDTITLPNICAVDTCQSQI